MKWNCYGTSSNTLINEISSHHRGYYQPTTQAIQYSDRIMHRASPSVCELVDSHNNNKLCSVLPTQISQLTIRPSPKAVESIFQIEIK